MKRRPFYFAAPKAVQMTQDEKNRRARIRRAIKRGAPWLVDATWTSAGRECAEYGVVSFRNGDVASMLDILNDRRFELKERRA